VFVCLSVCVFIETVRKVLLLLFCPVIALGDLWRDDMSLGSLLNVGLRIYLSPIPPNSAQIGVYQIVMRFTRGLEIMCFMRKQDNFLSE